jgi:N-acetylglucosamine kinase-like BadF-type ATPase
MEARDMQTILGIDGGATRTDAILSDEEGHILGRGVGGPSNYNVVGIEAAKASLKQAIEGALSDAQQDVQEVKAAAVGVPCRDEPPPISEWFANRLSNAKTIVVPDYELVLPAGTPQGWGVSIISGTGSVAFGRNPQGQRAMTGGWGYILGDEGSGYAIGLAALRSVARAQDGRSPRTMLTELILEAWGLKDLNDLSRRVYHGGTTHADIAALTSVVIEAAAASDAIALSLTREAGSELALSVAALVPLLNWPEQIPCAMGGSVLIKSDFVARTFLERVRELRLPLAPIQKVSEPVFGALIIARKLLMNPDRVEDTGDIADALDQGGVVRAQSC